MKPFAAVVALLALTSTSANAQKMPQDVRLHLLQTSTRAEANLRVAGELEAQLREQGLSLHGQLQTLRLRIEATLIEARTAADQEDWEALRESLKRADAWLDRLAKRMGGD